jgi:hypothetical protein
LKEKLIIKKDLKKKKKQEAEVKELETSSEEEEVKPKKTRAKKVEPVNIVINNTIPPVPVKPQRDPNKVLFL